MDVLFWVDIGLHDGAPITLPPVTKEVWTDASVSGFGAHAFQSVKVNQETIPQISKRLIRQTVTAKTPIPIPSDPTILSTQSRFTVREKRLHINEQEMIGAIEAIEALVPSDVSLSLSVDNSTTRWYILKMGGTRSEMLNALAIKFWEVVRRKNLQIRCNLVPSAENIADQISRQFKDVWDFSLNRTVYWEMCQTLKFVPKRDMFASRNCHLLNNFAAWMPTAGALGTNAMAIPFKDGDFLFPPVPLVLQVLQKVVQDKVEVLLVCPAWAGNLYYPLLMNLLVARPYKLPDAKMCLKDPSNNKPPTVILNPLCGFLVNGKI